MRRDRELFVGRVDRRHQQCLRRHEAAEQRAGIRPKHGKALELARGLKRHDQRFIAYTLVHFAEAIRVNAERLLLAGEGDIALAVKGRAPELHERRTAQDG